MNIFVTGANQGIGYYLALELLNRGNNVTVFDIEISALTELQQRYREQLLPIVGDVCNDEEMKGAVSQSAQRYGGIDIAIHNACLCTFDSLDNTPIELYRQVMDVNFYGALRLTKAVVPHMEKAGKGKVIFTSSGVGVTGFYNISPYASSKGALESLAKCLHQEYKDTGISFHLFHPPLTQTRSAAPLPVPGEMKAKPEVVGAGLARRIDKKGFIICHSPGQQFQIKLSYLFPLKLGGMMTLMTKRAQNG